MLNDTVELYQIPVFSCLFLQTMCTYYYIDPNGNKRGPINLERLKELAVQGIIGPHTRIITVPSVDKQESKQGRFSSFLLLMGNTIKQHWEWHKSRRRQRKEQFYFRENTMKNIFNLIFFLAFLFLFMSGLPLMLFSRIGCTNSTQNKNVVIENIVKEIDVFCRQYGYTLSSIEANPEKAIKDFDKEGNTLLHKAAEGGKIEVVKYLVSKGADVNAKAGNGVTPLHSAVLYNENTDVIKYLVSKGANINAKNVDGRTPLCIAITIGHTGCIFDLIGEGASVNAEDNDGFTPLSLAKAAGFTRIAEYLSSKGATLPLRPSGTFWDAVQNDDWVQMRRWIAYDPSLVNSTGRYIDYSYGGLFGNKPSIPPERLGMTPLILATLRGNIKMVEFLCKNGADPNMKNNTLAPLHLAALKLHSAAYKKLNGYYSAIDESAYAEIMRCLIDNGANVNIMTTPHGHTPLDLLHYDKSLSQVEYNAECLLSEAGGEKNVYAQEGVIYNY